MIFCAICSRAEIFRNPFITAESENAQNDELEDGLTDDMLHHWLEILLSLK